MYRIAGMLVACVIFAVASQVIAIAYEHGFKGDFQAFRNWRGSKWLTAAWFISLTVMLVLLYQVFGGSNGPHNPPCYICIAFAKLHRG